MATGVVEQDSLETASMLVNKALQSDQQYLDLSELLQVPKHNQPTVSGRMDTDYPKLGLAALRELGAFKKIPLPEELTEQYARMQCNCLMGVLPEISRAWLTIDSDIFVWNYEDGSDLAYFDGLGESILSVALLTPKPGIFQSHIEYLLCLCTPVDIVLLGVSFGTVGVGGMTRISRDEMHLLPEPLFSLPSDSVYLTCVVSTKQGRVFMAGKDGCLYELIYQAEDGWFSRKCRKVNHSTSKLSYVVPSFLNFSFVDDDALVQLEVDDSRNILYTRSEKGTIQVYDLGADGKGMCKVAAISHQTTVQNATLLAKSLDKSSFSPIVSIHAMPSSESTNVHLLAVTQSDVLHYVWTRTRDEIKCSIPSVYGSLVLHYVWTRTRGIRLYFTTCPFSEGGRARPSMLSMLHVRLPPGFSMSASVQKPSNIHKAFYSQGTLLMASRQTEDSEILWTICGDSFPFQTMLRETFETTRVSGNTWAVAEIGAAYDEDHVSGRPHPPAVVTQHVNPDRRFVLINPNESYVLEKLSPASQLQQLLLRNGAESNDVMEYFNLHKEQACATCLVLATNTQLTQQPVAELATRAFLLNGGDPEYNPNVATTLGPGSLMPQTPLHYSTPMQQGQSSSQYGIAAQGVVPGQADIVYSRRHRGICLHLARILRPIWERRIVTEYSAPNNKQKFLISTFKSEELSFVLRRLQNLRDFLNKHSQFASPLLAESIQASQSMLGRPSLGARADVLGARGDNEEQQRRRYQAEAERQEAASLREIQALVGRVCETLALCGILCEHQFHVICAALSGDQQNMLRNMNLSHLATHGKEVCSVLITGLINLYLDDHAATDAISERLREVCPTLYSHEDALCSKGNEKLQAARAKAGAEREKELQESLALYKQITAQLDLPVVCNQFAQARFFKGIVDLALTAANKRDPQGLALHFYKNGQPQDDTQGAYFFAARMDCYKCITESLDFLLSASQAHPQAPSVPKAPGPPPPKDPDTITNTEAEKIAEEVYSLALQSRDEMWHMALYDWLITKRLPEKLLEIQSPYLEPYLKQTAAEQPDQLRALDLLCRFYEKGKNYAAAARILAKLADRTGTDLTLTARMEYLSRAAMCAKSCTLATSGAAEGEFLHELEEKLDVARLQLQICEALGRSNAPEARDAVNRLNSQLFDITALYGDFADPFGLAECKLAILHCAGHHDPTLIESLYTDIIQQELHAVTDRRASIRALSNKIVGLGRTYGTSDRYFPIAFLIRELEQKSCELGLCDVDLSLVLSIMQQVGVTIPKLLQFYDRLHQAKEPCWKSLRRPYHVLCVIHQLLDQFANSPSSVPAYERRHLATVALDSVARYLVELQADSMGTDTVRQLTACFKDLQAKLERL